MKLRNSRTLARYTLIGLSLLSLPGCINTSNIETEKPHYSQWQWTVPFEILDETPQVSQNAH
jgi:hypothetical protein